MVSAQRSMLTASSRSLHVLSLAAKLYLVYCAKGAGAQLAQELKVLTLAVLFVRHCKAGNLEAANKSR
jgi:hypothetical protein